VVSTRIGAEGLPVAHGENILLADAPQDFAGQIAELFANPERAAQIGASGRTLVQSQFSWESVNRIFVAHCGAHTNSERSAELQIPGKLPVKAEKRTVSCSIFCGVVQNAVGAWIYAGFC
jgi:hypothetical protein